MARRSIALAVALLLVLAMAPVTSADEHGTNRPIWANLSGEVNFFPQTDPDCPILTVSDSYGTMSHLGKVWIHWSHCPPVVLPEYTNQHFTITAANGDTLIGHHDVNVDPATMDITDGTGRFAGATGHLLVTFQVEGEWDPGPPPFPISPWYAWWQMRGTLSY